MKTYYEVVHSETGKPKLSQEQKRGTPAYGYATKAQAMRFCPAGYVVLTGTPEGVAALAGGDRLVLSLGNGGKKLVEFVTVVR